LKNGSKKKDGSRFRVPGSGFQVQGSRFRVPGSGFQVQGSRFRVEERFMGQISFELTLPFSELVEENGKTSLSTARSSCLSRNYFS
jgi:hypothetical protein